MKLSCVFALLLAALLCTPALAFQDTKKDSTKDKKDDPKPKLKGTLPAGFRKLGLTDEQKQSVYKIQADYRDRIAALQAMIDKLRKEQKEKIEGVLSPTQLKALKGGK